MAITNPFPQTTILIGTGETPLSLLFFLNVRSYMHICTFVHPYTQEILRHDLAEGQYFVTGKLTREIFADDCRFVDPTNDVTGLSKYLTALGVLFDPQYSKVELLDIRVVGPRQVEADWRLGGYLVFPWRPLVQPFTGHTVYTLNESGLVSEQRQTWSISAATALLESFTPSWGPRKQLF
ncbi:hypothetical protein VOLCADRAFT_97844 [Volvox carteri f. nagariensis]|uniref:Uncharacterized protein n=1 Tax=Volvox carteri f. nagariensis TaxID=3068 RepID=D8UDS8_VOLCA|nr:uncharacterized protein VOLCADRAFT_97844 [Volvox carteri f. nagariensis]EFJ42095.1 hypothetical protein VOLCADRAFT_97844 [Volvox carteri f. nagariensis]|eukprot:XP_002956792.1 hypothetical protein VOLCADRAFT_97844 [Volvox carteri f. nagariensis]